MDWARGLSQHLPQPCLAQALACQEEMAMGWGAVGSSGPGRWAVGMEGLGWCPAGGPHGRMGGAQQSTGLRAWDSSALGVLAGLRAPGPGEWTWHRAGFSSLEAPVSPGPSVHLSPRQTLAKGSPVPSWAWVLAMGRLSLEERRSPGAGSQPLHWALAGTPEWASQDSPGCGQACGGQGPLEALGRGSRPPEGSAWGTDVASRGPSQLTHPTHVCRSRSISGASSGLSTSPLSSPRVSPPTPPQLQEARRAWGAGEAPRAGEAGPPFTHCWGRPRCHCSC